MLSPAMLELKEEFLKGVEDLLAERGIGPARVESYPQRMPTAMVAERLGVTNATVTNNRRSWGLKVVGRNKDGFIFEGASVARHVELQNKGSQ